MRGLSRRTVRYLLVLLAAFLLAMVVGFTALGRQVDADAYDWMFRLQAPAPSPPESTLLTIDDASLLELGGLRRLRHTVAEALERISGFRPKVVVIDITLPEEGDPADDAALERAMQRTPNLVLAAELLPHGDGWQEPLPRFRQWAAAVGHVHAAPDELDGVNRQIPLEKAARQQRYWALSLEAYRLSRGVDRILESPHDLRVGGLTIPAEREDARAIFVRYLPVGLDGLTLLPRVTVRELLADPGLAERFRDKVVFVGVTAQSAAKDRLATPLAATRPMPGVEIHANAFETLARGKFLRQAGDLKVVATCALLAAVAGAIFAFLSGWPAYALGGLLLTAAHLLPFLMFSWGTVFPFTAPVVSVWLSAAGAATYMHFAVRRKLHKAEAETSRYQQAVHFVTHEMRTPLTAIQGSSELISRYNLSDEKRKEIADLIHAESRRLSRMVGTFLSVERLSAGQMEMKREPFHAQEILDACLERTRSLAERKSIRLRLERFDDETFVGDRELMEYALYNLLNNAIKYSPAGSEVVISGRRKKEDFCLSVRDQGIGMDEKELQNIFRKFYRTGTAIASGEAGTGVGLSIADQIVSHHGGRIEVTSAPNQGSCFTLVLPVAVSARAAQK